MENFAENACMAITIKVLDYDLNETLLLSLVLPIDSIVFSLDCNMYLSVVSIDDCCLCCIFGL